MEPINLTELLDFNKKLWEMVDEQTRKQILTIPEDPYESSQINEYATALAKAQGEFPAVVKNNQNPYFKSSYADLGSIIEIIFPILAKHGLSVQVGKKYLKDGSCMLHTRVRHSSGQWAEDRTRLVPPKNDPQSFGSTLSYMARYSVVNFLGIALKDEDDDAEVAMVPERGAMAKGVALNTKYNPKEQSGETITKEQLEEVEYELGEYPDIAEMILDGFKIQSLADMPKNKYLPAVTRIREIKMLRNGSNGQK